MCVLGGGTAGWFAALHLRHACKENVEVMLVSTPEIPIVGVGEGGVLNFIPTLSRLNIPLLEFMQETSAVHKLGFMYEGWRDSHKNPDDYYYHMFPRLSDEKGFKEQSGFIPAFSGLINQNVPISYIVDSIQFQEKNISQNELTRMFVSGANKNFGSSFHFDTYKVGQYLKKIALQRGVIHKEGLFKEIERHMETGLVTAVQVDDTSIPVDFVIDASGFSRQILGNKLGAKWESFHQYLSLNTAIPFHLKHSKKNPDLVTRSTAMNAGWVWQIPLQERIGAGYVYNSDFISSEQAIGEIEQWLGHDIEPIRTIPFEAGFYKEAWQGNVLAIGLASGFVEPLEATSIGQMLESLHMLMSIFIESNWVVSKSAITYFNQQNTQGWHGIRDFIRMHYDTGRTDTPFWEFTKQDAVFSDQYLALKECWHYRTPRVLDLIPYVMDGNSIFGYYSWTAIAQALGVIRKEATIEEIADLSLRQQQELMTWVEQLKQRRGF